MSSPRSMLPGSTFSAGFPPRKGLSAPLPAPGRRVVPDVGNVPPASSRRANSAAVQSGGAAAQVPDAFIAHCFDDRQDIRCEHLLDVRVNAERMEGNCPKTLPFLLETTSLHVGTEREACTVSFPARLRP